MRLNLGHLHNYEITPFQSRLLDGKRWEIDILQSNSFCLVRLWLFYHYNNCLAFVRQFHQKKGFYSKSTHNLLN